MLLLSNIGMLSVAPIEASKFVCICLSQFREFIEVVLVMTLPLMLTVGSFPAFAMAMLRSLLSMANWLFFISGRIESAASYTVCNDGMSLNALSSVVSGI